MTRNQLALTLERSLFGALLKSRSLFKGKNKPEPFDASQVRTIVISKFVGLGSILLMQKLFRQTRKNFPKARIIFLTLESSKPLLEIMGGVDEVLFVESRGLLGFLRSVLRTIRIIRRKKVDLFLDAEFYSRFSAWVVSLSKARWSAGFDSTYLECRSSVYSHRADYDWMTPITENFCNLLRAFGVPVDKGVGYPVLENQKKSDPSKVIVFNPSGGGALDGYRLWPHKNWAELIRLFLKRGESSIVLTGLGPDRNLVESILNELTPEERKHTENVCGQFDFREYLSFLGNARLVVSVDSGTPHFSAALGVPTAILFGPETPKLYGYESPHVKNISKMLYCSPCYQIYNGKKVVCGNEHRCLETLSPREVFQKASELL